MGKEGGGLIFPLVCSSLSSSTPKKGKKDKSTTQKGNIHMPPYKIFLCIVYLSTIFPPWQTLISFNLVLLPYVQRLRFFLPQPSKLLSHDLVLQLRYYSHIKHSKIIIFRDYRLKSCNIYLFGMTTHCNTLQTNESATPRPFLQRWYLATCSVFL